MKIKMILKYDIESLEKEVNEFIENVEVIDIEYEIVSEPGTFISMHKHIAMIMYEEKSRI